MFNGINTHLYLELNSALRWERILKMAIASAGVAWKTAIQVFIKLSQRQHELLCTVE